jgi:hypothetical protein
VSGEGAYARPGRNARRDVTSASVTSVRRFVDAADFPAKMSAMFGPRLLARTLSSPVRVGKKSSERWQYHSRSDRHSKAACWGTLFDLMMTSRLLAEHVAAGRVGFGINHEMRDFRQNRKKDLDLVLCTPAQTSSTGRTFESLADLYQFELSDGERAALRGLPVLREARVASVLIALEAKACMTAHVKAIPRLYDELNSSQQTIHGASEMVIAGGFVMVNTAPFFVSPGRVGYCPKCGHRVSPVNRHKQPEDAARVIEKVKQLPRRASVKEEGFDALAIVAVECRNDGSPVTLVEGPPAPAQGDILEYNQMIARLAHLYEARFPRI